MESFINIFFVCTAVFELAILLVFWREHYSRAVMMSVVLVPVIFIPLAASLSPLRGSFPVVSLAGLFLFPAAFCLCLFKLVPPARRRLCHLVYPLTLLSLAGFALLPGKERFVLSGMYLGLDVLVLAMFYPLRLFRGDAVLPAGVLLNAVLLAAALTAGYGKFPAPAAGLLNLTLFLMLVMNYRKRMRVLSVQFGTLADLNRRLTHTVNRLRQSMEQSHKIILEKDLELLQLSRHASLAEVTTGIAHELAQPLTGIKGIAQNMIDDIQYDEFDNLQGVAELTRISSLVDKSSSIINHVRNFSRKNIFSLRPVDLNQIILDAVELVHVQLKNSDIELQFVLDENIPRISGDRVSLEQLILNMVLNSKDAITEKKADASGHEGIIRVSTFLREERVNLVVEDNGGGIPREHLNKIWSPFFTTKRRSHGTGIGLSISSKIIREHGAVVNIETGDSGTRFIIRFSPCQDT